MKYTVFETSLNAVILGYLLNLILLWIGYTSFNGYDNKISLLISSCGIISFLAAYFGEYILIKKQEQHISRLHVMLARIVVGSTILGYIIAFFYLIRA